MSRIEDLAAIYEKHIEVPWQRTLAGAQRVVIVIYDKEWERPFRARKGEFEQATIRGGHRWVEFDCTSVFAQWMASNDYRDAYFENPDDLALKLGSESTGSSEFTEHVASLLRDVLQRGEVDANTVVALTGTASLYGFANAIEVSPFPQPELEPCLRVALGQAARPQQDAEDRQAYLGTATGG